MRKILVLILCFISLPAFAWNPFARGYYYGSGIYNPYSRPYYGAYPNCNYTNVDNYAIRMNTNPYVGATSPANVYTSVPNYGYNTANYGYNSFFPTTGQSTTSFFHF